MKLRTQTVNNGGKATAEICPTIDHVREKQCKNKDLDLAREKTRTHFGASFQRLRELREICKDSRGAQSVAKYILVRSSNKGIE